MDTSNYTIILGSKSPRRQELLKLLGIDFAIQTKEIEEVYPDDLKSTDVSTYLAELKANAFKVEENQVFITSDTTVVFEDKILGKPANREEAIETINMLSGNKHQVITGVCIKTINQQVIFKEITHVYFKELTEQEVIYYVDTFRPYDKAGAYAIQEWIGAVGIKRIDGCYYNVVGLPLFKLSKHLKELLPSISI